MTLKALMTRFDGLQMLRGWLWAQVEFLKEAEILKLKFNGKILSLIMGTFISKQ